MASEGEIILFHYSFSPYARRIVWYVDLVEQVHWVNLKCTDVIDLGIWFFDASSTRNV